MNVLRFLRPACIQLDLATAPLPIVLDETGEEPTAAMARRKSKEKDLVMAELAEILARSPDVVNPTKLHKDLIHRENNASTAIAPGVAIPHVRTLQARAFFMGFARAADPGLHYASLDGDPTRLFFLMAAPPYDDRTYHLVQKEIAQILRDDDMVDELLAVETPQDVFNSLRRFFR